MSNTNLLASASLFALGFMTVGPALAADLYEPPVVPVAPPGRTISGTLDLYGGFSWLTGEPVTGDDETDDSYPLVGGKGRVDIPFSQTTSLQLDLGGEAAFSQGSDSTSAADNYAGNVTLGAHLNYRQMDRYLFGVFGGGGASFHNDTGSTGPMAPFWFVGLEGQTYFGNSTVYGQVGYLDSNHPATETLENAWFVRGVGRHFFNQGQTKAEGELSFASGHQDAGTANVNIFGWGLELEHQFWSFGNDGFLAGYVRYEGRHFNETTDVDKYTEHTLMVGLKADLNQMNLLSRDRSGATLDLPNFGRWVGGTITLD